MVDWGLLIFADKLDSSSMECLQGKASQAERMASLVSLEPMHGTCVITSPVAGLVTYMRCKTQDKLSIATRKNESESESVSNLPRESCHQMHQSISLR